MRNKAPFEYTLIRSSRKSISIRVTADCEVVVRAPLFASKKSIEALLCEKAAWIEARLSEMKRLVEDEESSLKLSEEEKAELVKKARACLTGRAEYFAPLVGVIYGRIAIRCQKTRWGSCSGKRNLNFNCLLMLCPEEVRDYVVVHELCHILEMNHSPAFYAQVERVLPDWRARKKLLDEVGPGIMRRIR